jgi:adenylate cyclase
MGSLGKSIDTAVLLVDVVGSTPLYESVGNAVAMDRIADWRESLCALVRLHGGEFISSKGDDVLSIFDDPTAAFSAAAQMREPATLPISFHAGLHFGPVIRAGADIYGDAVNLTARLAAIANPGEILISQSLVDRLSPVHKDSLGFLDKVNLKGKGGACNIYAFLDHDRSLNTQISIGRLSKIAAQETPTCGFGVTLRYNGQSISCLDNETLTIGRSSDCSLVIDRQWVSRHHATVRVANGRVQLVERSSSGTFVSMRPGQEVLVRREDVLLLGSGTISPGLQSTSDGAQVVHFEIVML